MTDKEKLIELLTGFGVGFVENKDRNFIECEEGKAKIGGYHCFITLFNFDDDDKFETMGAFE